MQPFLWCTSRRRLLAILGTAALSGAVSGQDALPRHLGRASQVIIPQARAFALDTTDRGVEIESVRARVEVGQADLANLTQLDLRIERHHDHRDAHRQEERAAAAALRAVLGVDPGTRVPTTEAPREVHLPDESEAALFDAARTHPAVESFEHAARGALTHGD